MTTRIADIIVPAEFTAYIVENSLVSTALFQSGVAQQNGNVAERRNEGMILPLGLENDGGDILGL